MNLGKNIAELRKSRNVKQEELAAELGVTSAAVSKWENNNTLPDIYMLCAIADYFRVTTDALLGREMPAKCAVVAASTEELAKKIAGLANQYGIEVKSVHMNLEDACRLVREDEQITYALIGYPNSGVGTVLNLDFGDRTIGACVDISNTEENILRGIEEYLKNNQ